MSTKKGSIHVITGGMSSCKSTELLRLIRRHLIANDKCCLIKSIKDTRYGSNYPCVTTHDGQSWEATISTNLYDVYDTALCNDVICIDEGQFFPRVDEFASDMANNHGKKVIIAALNSTFEMKPFPNVSNLFAIAETITKFDAVCIFCRSTAYFSKRLSDEKEIEVVGGLDKYAAVCRNCFFKDTV